jgi:hypothetical protein
MLYDLISGYVGAVICRWLLTPSHLRPQAPSKQVQPNPQMWEVMLVPLSRKHNCLEADPNYLLLIFLCLKTGFVTATTPLPHNGSRT